MLSALASGRSLLEGLSPGEDVAATARIVTQLGARLDRDQSGLTVVGPDEGLRSSESALDCENSGTSMRLLSGLVAGIDGEHLLIGDVSLSRRPMDRVAIPLRRMGATVSGEGPAVHAPLRVTGRAQLRAIDYEVPVPSAQVKSAILLAGLVGDGPSTIVEAVRTRSTTEDMLRTAGVLVHSDDVGAGRRVRLVPGRPSSRRWRVPGDPSQAAFFAVLGALHPDARIEISPIDHAPERVGFLEVLRRMGADVQVRADGSLLAVSSGLRATIVDATDVPSVDEVPILAVAAAAAEGVSTFCGMAELRVKESDRFEGTITLVRALGCEAWSEGNDFFVVGLGSAGKFRSFSLNVQLDHRMVMSGAVAAVAGNGGQIEGADSITSSYPAFFEDLELLL